MCVPTMYQTNMVKDGHYVVLFYHFIKFYTAVTTILSCMQAHLVKYATILYLGVTLSACVIIWMH